MTRSTCSHAFDDARRLGQHAERPEPGVDLHGVARLERDDLRAVAVDLLDAPLAVAAVATHVELAASAARAGVGIGAAHDADDEVAGDELRAVRRLSHAPERLVPEDEAVAVRRRPAVGAGHDLAVGAADAERDHLDEQLAVTALGLGDGRELLAAGPAGDDGDGKDGDGGSPRSAAVNRRAARPDRRQGPRPSRSRRVARSGR
jgi:hypothetical protein